MPYKRGRRAKAESKERRDKSRNRRRQAARARKFAALLASSDRRPASAEEMRQAILLGKLERRDDSGAWYAYQGGLYHLPAAVHDAGGFDGGTR